MPQRFNIAIAQPRGYQHSPVFHDLARLLELSLQSLGHSASIRYGEVDDAAINIAMGYHMLGSPEGCRDMIVYQLEPLGPRDPRYQPRWLDLLRAAREIWDYSPLNIEFLRDNGITNVKLLPIGYHPALRTIPTLADEPIDVLFYGSKSDRRVPIIRQLMERCAFKLLWAIYGAERDRWIAQSKIILNVHGFDGQPFERVRVSYLLNNARFVVSEDSEDNPWRDGMALAPCEELVQTCLDYLARPDERRRIANAGHDLFARQPMPELLKKVLD